MNAENTNRSKLNKMIRYFQYGKFHCLQYIGHAKKLKSDCKDFNLFRTKYSEIPIFLCSFLLEAFPENIWLL